MTSPRQIIYGTVPGTTILPPLPEGIRVDEEPVGPETTTPKKAKKRPGPKPKDPDRAWRTGYPPGTKKEDIASGRAVPSSNRPPPLAGVAAERCVGCKQPVATVTLSMMQELLRVARDRLAHEAGDGRTDLLYLAARMDGYCSLGCWMEHGPEGLVARMAEKRR